MTKLFYAFLIFIVFPSLLFGQTYQPMVEPGNKWNIYSPDNQNGGDFIVPQITCDTIQRDGNIYNYIRCGFGPCAFDTYVREDTSEQKVFYIDPDSNESEKLYLDFDLSVGDTFPYLPNYSPVVDSIYQGFLFGRIRKVIVLDSLLSFIQGIGSSTYGPLPARLAPSSLTSFGEVACDEIFTETNELANSENQISIYPNPSSGLIHIAIDSEEGFVKENNVLRIFNLLGELIFENSFLTENYFINLKHVSNQTVVVTIQTATGNFSQLVVLTK